MDHTRASQQNGRHSNLSRLLLLLFLSGFQPVRSSDKEKTNSGEQRDRGGLQVSIIGPDYVTIGVPISVECDANCPACTYSMSLDRQSALGQGNVLAFTVNFWMEALTVTCTATDEETEEDEEKLTATATKRLQVLAGPANISISGPDSMNPSVSHTYSCYAGCRPSCTFSWRTGNGPWIRGQGNVVSITPKEKETSILLICKATNSVSGLFAAATRTIRVTSGPAEIQIKGPDTIEKAKNYTYVCTAQCWPSCRYLLSMGSQTLKGNSIEINVEHSHESVTLQCEAQNTASRRTAKALKTIQVKGRHHNLSTRPEGTLAALLLAFIISAALTL